MNFPNGAPGVSDVSMEDFMEAVYEQQQMPTNITGVPVTLYVLDSNNNYRAIGTTTTNAQGNYGLTWTPDIPGTTRFTRCSQGRTHTTHHQPQPTSAQEPSTY